MKSWFRKLPLIVSLLLTALVLAVWVRTYIIGDRYRWIGLYQRDGKYWMTNRSFTSGYGGLAILSERTEPSDNPQNIASIRRYLATSRDVRAGYMVSRSPRYPLPARDPGDETLFNSLGMHFSNLSFQDSRGDVSRLELSMPFWAIFAVTSAYPIVCYVMGVIRRQREERGPRSICRRCGQGLLPGATRCDCCDLPTVLAREI